MLARGQELRSAVRAGPARQGTGSDAKRSEAASQPKAREQVLCIGFKIELPRQLDAKVAKHGETTGGKMQNRWFMPI